MPTSSISPEKRSEIGDLERAIRAAVESEIGELAANLADTDDAHLLGDNEFKVRAIALKIAAKAYQQHLARKKATASQAAKTPPDTVAPVPPGAWAVSSWIGPSS